MNYPAQDHLELGGAALPERRCWPWFHRWGEWQKNSATLAVNVGDKVPFGLALAVILKKRCCKKCSRWQSDIDVVASWEEE